MASRDDTLRRLDIPAASSTARKIKQVVLVLVVLGAIGAGVAVLARRGPTAPRFETDPVARGDIVASVTATGALRPRHTVEVAPQVSGRVVSVHAEVNASVHVGDVLVELDTTEIRARIAEARANVESAAAALSVAETSLEQARTSAARAEELRRREVSAEADLDTARAALRRAEADVAGARARLSVARAAGDRARVELGRSTIVSPIDGVVLVRAVEPGQTVAAAFTAPVLFQIAEDLTRMELHVDVDEADVGRVREGQPATFVVDAHPERTFRAEITRLHYASHLVDRIVAYEAELLVENPDGALRPGMTATATIETGRRAGVLTVSNRALRFSPPEGPRFGSGGPRRAVRPDGPAVWILRDGQPAPLRVTVGGTDGTRSEVSGEGVTEGLALLVGQTREATP